MTTWGDVSLVPGLSTSDVAYINSDILGSNPQTVPEINTMVNPTCEYKGIQGDVLGPVFDQFVHLTSHGDGVQVTKNAICDQVEHQ